MKSLLRLPSSLLVRLIGIYQHTLSPVLPVLTLGTCGCRFTPTCSHYASAAIQRHGVVRGGWLALRRLLKCTPLHPGGFDPVPEQSVRRTPFRRRPVCRAAARATPGTTRLP